MREAVVCQGPRKGRAPVEDLLAPDSLAPSGRFNSI